MDSRSFLARGPAADWQEYVQASNSREGVRARARGGGQMNGPSAK